METFSSILEEMLNTALGKVSTIAQLTPLPRAGIERVQNTQFGDYQSNIAMVLAKKLKTNPRELAGEIIDRMEVEDFCDPPEIAGPGFINFRISMPTLE